MKSTALVKVVSTSTCKVPLDFPYANWVRLNLHGDLEDLETIKLELEAVKAEVNRDISRFKMNLHDYRIAIKLELNQGA